MSFTDEDMKRLKEARAKNEFIDWVDFEALLARLEAAEALLPAWQQQDGEYNTSKIWLDAWLAWRKACGKSDPEKLCNSCAIGSMQPCTCKEAGE